MGISGETRECDEEFVSVTCSCESGGGLKMDVMGNVGIWRDKERSGAQAAQASGRIDSQHPPEQAIGVHLRGRAMSCPWPSICQHCRRHRCSPTQWAVSPTTFG